MGYSYARDVLHLYLYFYEMLYPSIKLKWGSIREVPFTNCWWGAARSKISATEQSLTTIHIIWISIILVFRDVSKVHEAVTG